MKQSAIFVIPAKAGIQTYRCVKKHWSQVPCPANAGFTRVAFLGVH